MKKIAYLVLAHSDPLQLERLVNAIAYRAQVFIHVDAKTDIAPFEALALPPSSTLLANRVAASWGGISLIDATLRLIQAALAYPAAFSHLVLLSGADYPIKPLGQIYETITRDPHHEFIRYFDMRSTHKLYLRHIHTRWFKEPWIRSRLKWLAMAEKGCRFIATRLRLPNHWDPSVVPYFGSQWWALTPACCRYIIDYVKAHPEFYAMNRLTFSPDEHFIHTIVGNSPFAACADDIIPYRGWRTWLATTNIHLINESLAKYYAIQDLDEIMASDRLFVRKMSTRRSSELIAAINERLLNPSPSHGA